MIYIEFIKFKNNFVNVNIYTSKMWNFGKYNSFVSNY